MATLRGLRGESGQALVEFALVAPLIIFLTVGAVEFARAWNVRQVLSHAARDGARLASLPSAAIDQDSVESAIRTVLQAAALDDGLATVVVDGISGDPGSSARVQISYPFEVRVLRMLTGEREGRLTLRAASVMRNE